MQLTRREFVRGSTLAVLAPGLPIADTPLTSEAQPLPIVDTHQHLWDLDKFTLRWLDSASALRRSYLTKDYLEATRGLNVVKAVYMEVDVVVEQQTAEARHVIELCRSKDHPTVAAVISGRPGSESFTPYIEQFKDSPYIKGVRQVLHSTAANRGACLEKTFLQSIRRLGQLGMSFDLCMRPTELGDAVKLVDRCPETRFILDHCGNADPNAFGALARRADNKPSHDVRAWKQSIAELAKRKHVVCKISGIIARVPKGRWSPADLAPIINHCLNEFGPDRVMFGGDWPVCTLAASYRQWVKALKAVVSNRPREDQRRLFSENAITFYGLSSTS